MPGLAASVSAHPSIALVGRDDVLAAAERLFAHPDNRLITVTGPAGVGKTRLAIELLRLHGEPAGRETIAVDLSALGTPDDIDAGLARAVGITPAEGDSLADAVPRWLATHEK